MRVTVWTACSSPSAAAQPAGQTRRLNQVERERGQATETAQRLRTEAQATQREIARLDRELAVPDLYARDPAKGADYSKQRMALAAALAEAEELWIDTGERLAAAEAAE